MNIKGMEGTQTMNFVTAIALGVAATQAIPVSAQEIGVDRADVTRIIEILAADGMEGRRAFTPAIDRAANFISAEFEAIGLQPLVGAEGYLQTFGVENRPGRLANVAGMLLGRRANEFVLFSAHYDHIGYQPNRAVAGDSIGNGANDNASGTTAVISLARYFKKLGTPERTLLFVAFTAEEMGGLGSRHFSQQLDPAAIVAMFNVEMIGKPAREGPNTAWITGFDRSDFGQILQKAVEGTKYEFYPDPYPSQNLFFRSDNDHMTNTIQAIATAAATIVSGAETPTRVRSVR